jgi:hypothetical protein
MIVAKSEKQKPAFGQRLRGVMAITNDQNSRIYLGWAYGEYRELLPKTRISFLKNLKPYEMHALRGLHACLRCAALIS